MKPTSSFWSPSSRDDLRGGSSTAGCLSRMLRRILCFSSLPLCSFDHFKEDEREGEVVIGATPTPPGVGVVARLMGLNSLPRVDPVEESPLLGQVDSFKTSRSPQVRPIPAYRELEDDNFFILSFEKRHESRRRKSSRNSNKENENPENVLLPLKNPCKKSEKNTTRLAKKDCLAAKIAFENEGDSENSSPNSVLEFVGFSADQESASPGGISRLANSKMRRPLSEELENCGDSKGKAMVDGLDLEGGNLVRSRHNCSERLDEVGKMAGMDTMRSSWLHDETLQNKHSFMEIGRDLASNIFDHLLEELVINLEQF